MADKKISALTAATTPLAGTEVLPIVQSGTTVKATVANIVGAGTSPGSFTTLAASSDVSATNGTIKSPVAMNLKVTDAGGTERTAVTLASPIAGSTQGFTFTAGKPGATYPTMTASGGAINVTADVISTGNFVVGTSGKGIDFSANTNAAGMTSEVLTWYEEGTWTPTIAGQITAGTGTYTTQVGRYTRIGRVVYVSLNLAWSAHTGTGDMQVNGLPFTVNSSVTSQMSNGTYDLALTALNMLLARAQTSGTFIKLLQSPVGGGAWNGVPMDTSVTVLEITGFYTV